MNKNLTILMTFLVASAAMALAGPERYSGKEMKQTTAPAATCPQWYADQEWNVSIWGTYAFTETESARTNAETSEDNAVFGSYDRFLGGDHAWGGGADVKYFFLRYFGVGLEGFGLAARGSHLVAAEEEHTSRDEHAVGAALGTFTLRYPIGCTRFAPYAFVGGGGIFGGHNDRPRVVISDGEFFGGDVTNENESRLMGQFGGGIEVRVTQHFGIIQDFSYNVVEGPHNNFFMVRAGFNMAF